MYLSFCSCYQSEESLTKETAGFVLCICIFALVIHIILYFVYYACKFGIIQYSLIYVNEPALSLR